MTRTCVGCRRVAAPDELVRVVRTPAGTLELGRTLPGRGAWLCRRSSACLAEARRRNAFTRAFRAPVTASAVAQLSEAIAGVCEDRELHPDGSRVEDAQ